MKKEKNHIYKAIIIGAGVSGVTTAIRLGELGISNLVIEKKESVVNGPPFCHLHAGGNLYPYISVEQCLVLLRQSIDMAKMFPESIDQRPTFISIPRSEDYAPSDLINRLQLIVNEYQKLSHADATNEILGEPHQYFKLYHKEDLDDFKQKDSVLSPESLDDWMIEVSKIVDYDKLKFPVLLVQEYGWNLFRLAAEAHLAIDKLENCDLLLNTEALHITNCIDEHVEYNWKVKTNGGVYYAEYLINAAGYKTGEIDNEVNLRKDRLVEFKAAYVSKWEHLPNIPELIFQGKRGTSNGMAQLTPYADGYYQIHGMTEDITLFQDGLVQNTPFDAQPRLNDSLKDKINSGWDYPQVVARTERAINHVARFVPSFKHATTGSKPLYGAQQIPGNDKTLRVGEVRFPKKYYAVSEIIKASSALDVADKIVQNLKDLNLIRQKIETEHQFETLDSIKEEDIHKTATLLAEQRGYPGEMGKLYRFSIKHKMKG
ncbi:FAD-dependent oxidoreductase [Flavobacteriaceae bacterium Ap0902]|nr:FAD-dependent oxidoreductase [Flavobacteriaceae bacterium Ap0902]